MLHDRRTARLLAAALLVIVTGCGGAGSVLDSGSSVIGTVTYRERIALTPGAKLIV